MVGSDGRFRLVRTVKRTSPEDRWKIASPSDPFSAGDVKVTPASRAHGAKSVPPLSVWRGRWSTSLHLVQIMSRSPRRLYLKQGDFLAHGTSDGCPGCRARVSGGRAQGHTEECGTRVEGNRGGPKPAVKLRPPAWLTHLRDVWQRGFDLQKAQETTSWTVEEGVQTDLATDSVDAAHLSC